jgi:hypothetical protein
VHAVPSVRRGATTFTLFTLGREAGRTQMKKLLLLGALTAITLFQAAQPSEAYFRGKWCA